MFLFLEKMNIKLNERMDDFGFLHIKPIDDAGHGKAVKLKGVGFRSSYRAIGQLARILWEAERADTTSTSFVSLETVLLQMNMVIIAIGEGNEMNTLDDFPLPSVTGEDLVDCRISQA